jgi:hypothetical protein
MLENLNTENLNTFKTQVCWHEYSFIVLNKYNNLFINAATTFAKDMATKKQSIEYYEENRNATTPFNDTLLGKYGEFACSLVMNVEGFPKLKPDVEIRTGRQKGWDCDLPFKKINDIYPNCGVKTCDGKMSDFLSRSRPDKYSWTFQYGNSSGPGGRDRLFSNPDSDEIILFMFVPYLASKENMLVASAPWNKLQGIIEDPILDKYKGLKKCIYSEDLKAISNFKVKELVEV